MCNCVKQKSSTVPKIKNGWRINALFRIEKLIREVGQDARAKRMGICGNTINIKDIKGDHFSIMFEPQLRCKDRVCPVCNSYRASIMARKVEKLGKDMINPHLLTVTANVKYRNDLKIAFQNFKDGMRKFKQNRSWFRNYLKGGVEHIEIVKNKNTGWHIHAHLLVDMDVDRKVENMRWQNGGMYLDPIKKELEKVLDRVGLGTVSDIRPVTEGYGKEISKYSMKFATDITDEDLKEIIVVLKGKRMVSRFGSCYGKKDDDIDELTEDEQREYRYHGSIEDVVYKCFADKDDVEDGYLPVDRSLIEYVKEAIKIGLIALEFPD